MVQRRKSLLVMKNILIQKYASVYVTALAMLCGSIFAQEKEYPGLPIRGVRIGMSLEALKSISGVNLVERGHGRQIGISQKDDQTCLFFFQDEKLLQVSYSWERMEEGEQFNKTREIISEFSARFGKPVKSKTSRLFSDKTILVTTLKYSIGSSNEAVIESWGSKLLVTVGGSEEMKKSEGRLSVRHEKAVSETVKDDHDGKKGVVTFGASREKTSKGSIPRGDLSGAVLAPVDFLEHLDG